MKFSTIIMKRMKRDRHFTVAVLFVLTIALAFFAGCVANDDNAMPWAAPEPGDYNIRFPGNFSN